MTPDQITVALHDLEVDQGGIQRSEFCAEIFSLLRSSFRLLTPPEDISTTQCAEESRYLPGPKGGVRLWSRELTPYIVGIQDALDDLRYTTVAVVGPARSGKSVAGFNHLHKRLMYGPLTDVLWYLPGPEDVDQFVDTEVQTYFDLHPDIFAKIGKRSTDNKRKFKRIAGRSISFNAANPRTVRGRQAPYIVADEPDAYHVRLRSNFKQQLDFRGRSYGRQRKAYICSHADMGWKGGIAPVWKEGTRGVWYWPCPDCSGWSSPCPMAESRTTIWYKRLEGVSEDEYLAAVKESAALQCPHCGSLIGSDKIKSMNGLGVWVFDGQVISKDGEISGQPIESDTASFWIHGTMSPFVTVAELAVEYESALLFFQKTGDDSRLKEVTVKSIGEVYEGADEDAKPVQAEALRKSKSGSGFSVGELPPWSLYLTAAIDPGGSKFDAAVFAHGFDGERALVDRFTKTQHLDLPLRPGERAGDWSWIATELLTKVYPFADNPSFGLPVASIAIDTGGVPGVTWNARNFARQCLLRHVSGVNGFRIRLLKGSASKTAEIIRPREINRDDRGRPMDPPVTEYDINVHKMKIAQSRQLRTTVPGPGYWWIAEGFPLSVFEELCAEVLVGNEWERRGPNETWDLGIYAEFCRKMLGPERVTDWASAAPPWARRVKIKADASLAGGTDNPGPRKRTPAQRRAELNSGAW